METTTDSLSKEGFTSEFFRYYTSDPFCFSPQLATLCRGLHMAGICGWMERRKKVDTGTTNILAALPLKGTGNANEMNLRPKTPRPQQQTTEIFKDEGT